MAPALRAGRRVVVLCEGDTEELAVRYFVWRQWRDEGLASVGLKPINLYGKLEDTAKFATDYLDDQQVLSVFALIDLLRMNRVRHQPNDALEVKVARVRDWLCDRVVHPRQADFHPHVSVHEVEAWILAEGKALSQRLQDASIAPDPQAEVKNFLKPPSKRISEYFRRSKRTRYRKIADGRPLFSKMEFQPVYDSCQYFRKFYDDLRAVARQ
jgi:hypothetical protein